LVRNSFASEKWIKENIKGVKQGATPSFGDIWDYQFS